MYKGMPPRVPAPANRKMVIYTISYQYKDKNAEGRATGPYKQRTKEMRLTIRADQDETLQVPIAVDIEIGRTERDSPFFIRRSSVSYTINTVSTVSPRSVNHNTIRMRRATALALDGSVAQDWDTNNNTCVYDFVIWRYSNSPGCKKICNYEALDNIFKAKMKIYYTGEPPMEFTQGMDSITYAEDKNGKYYMINNDFVTVNPRTDGVCAYQLNNLCDALGCRSYAFDEQNRIVNSYVPVKNNRKIPPLVYRIKDNHFYAITDINKSVSQIGKHNTDLQVETEHYDVEPKQLEVVLIPEGKRPSEKMVDIMRDVGKQVYPFKNLQVDKTGIRGFKLDGKQYLFDDNDAVKTAMKIAEINNAEYTGDSTFTLLVKMMEDLDYTHKSVFNPQAYEIITADNIKYRTHYGFTTDKYTVEMVDKMLEDGKAICSDIAKAFTSVLLEPMDEWIQYDFNDHWEPVKRQPKTFKFGLYYIETTDLKLLHSGNIYSHTILNKAREEGIEFKVRSQWIPTGKALPKSYFLPLLDRIHTDCKGDPLLKKNLTNIITGFLGKHQSERYVARINTDPDVVFNDFTDEAFHNNETFMYKVEEFYIYGYIVKQDFAENNIPLYIQILDQANIKLYNMIKESGGECVWRKTDCAVIVGGSLPLTSDANAKPGSYRPSDFFGKPTIEKTAEERNVYLPALHTYNWITHPVVTRPNGEKNMVWINESGQTQEVFDVLMEYKGLVNLSRAGTGKSYNVLQIEKMFKAKFPEGKVYKLAFTNKACLNIRGTTIHKFLKINKEGKLNLLWLETLRKQDVLFMIDEVSMISGFLWRRLVELKKAVPDAYFLLCGDFRQVPAVEPKQVDYTQSSALKYLASCVKIEFTKRQRYDEALWDFAEQITTNNTTQYDKITTHSKDVLTPPVCSLYINICYYNATRKNLNAEINKYIANSKSQCIQLPYIPEDIESDGEEEITKDLQQDAIIYTGLPIIAHRNKGTNKNSNTSDDDEKEMVNNETFTITECDEEFITAVAKRVDDEGNEYDHIITFPTEEFHSRFVLNYCTTTHKSQGATIDDNILIWDYEAMNKNLRYTAVTRCKNIKQINIVI